MAIVKVLVVAGGANVGGGVSGTTYNAGGGGGQVVYKSSLDISGGSYTVTIGNNSGTAAGDSYFGTIMAVHGNTGYTPAHGGTSGNGYAGGAWTGSGWGGGGGGGNAGIGQPNSGNTPGLGGSGTANSITGTSVTYGAGGRGGGAIGNINGAANTGTGGGGDGGTGGSGIVVVRYLTADFGTCTGGTITTSGTDTIHTFTSSGTFVAIPMTTNYIERSRRTKNLGQINGQPNNIWQPKDIPNCALWIDATQHTTTADGQNATTIYDLSGNGNNLTQRNTGAVWVASGFLGKPVFRFDGARNYGFTEITGIRTVFWVIKEDADVAVDQYKFLLGHTTLYEFHRGAGKTIWNSTHAPKMFGGTTKVNGVTCDGRSTNMPTTLSLVSVQTSSGASANQFNSDRDIAGRYWDGDMGEIIIYTRYLTQEEFLKVENYLRAKWGTG